MPPKPFWLTPESPTPGPLVLTVVLNICVFVPQVECNPLDILRKVTVAVREEGREERADITSTFDPENSSETQDVAYPTFSLAVPVSKHPTLPETGTGTVTPTPEYISTTPTPTLTSSPSAFPFAAPAPTYALASASASVAASTLVLNTTNISNNDCLTLSQTDKSDPNSNALLITLTILLGILLSIIVVVFLGVWVFRFGFRFGFRGSETGVSDGGQFSFNTNTESAVDRIESGVASRDVDIDIEDRKYAFGGSGLVAGVVPVLASEV